MPPVWKISSVIPEFRTIEQVWKEKIMNKYSKTPDIGTKLVPEKVDKEESPRNQEVEDDNNKK